MSIIIPLIYSSKGVQVQRATVPVGYSLPTYDVFVEKMIAEVLTHIKLFPDKLPDFDTVTSMVPGYPPVILGGSAFSVVMSFSQLIRSGADKATILKMANDHLAALGQIDRTAYNEADEKEYQDALRVTAQFVADLQRDI